MFLPTEEAGEIVARAWVGAGIDPRADMPAFIREVVTLQTLSAWRVTQGVYRYDESLREALVSTPHVGDLPVDALRRLPEWCVYVETPGLGMPRSDGSPVPLVGVWAWLDWAGRLEQPPQPHPQLVLGLDLERADVAESLPATVVPLAGGTLEDATRIVEANWTDGYRRGLSRRPPPGYARAVSEHLPPLLSLVLYLCSEDADLGGRRPERPEATRTKRGPRLFPPGEIAAWDVGVRIGARIREVTGGGSEPRGQTESGRARPRPHWRRAHWHGYWSGPRDPERASERSHRLRWIPPTPVNARDDAEAPVTIRRVSEP